MDLVNFKEKTHQFKKMLWEQKKPVLLAMFHRKRPKIIIKRSLIHLTCLVSYIIFLKIVLDSSFNIITSFIISLLVFIGLVIYISNICYLCKFIMWNVLIKKAKKDVESSSNIEEGFDYLWSYSKESSHQFFGDFFVDEESIIFLKKHQIYELSENSIQEFKKSLNQQEIELLALQLEKNYDSDNDFFTIDTLDSLLQKIDKIQQKAKSKKSVKLEKEKVSSKLGAVLGDVNLLKDDDEIYQSMFEVKQDKKTLKTMM